jgi:hypothetical protein
VGCDGGVWGCGVDAFVDVRGGSDEMRYEK